MICVERVYAVRKVSYPFGLFSCRVHRERVLSAVFVILSRSLYQSSHLEVHTMPTLFSWTIKAHGPVSIAHGVVSGHPKLPEGEHIHTSPILRSTQQEGCILLETASGSTYRLRLEEMDSSSNGSDPPLADPDRLGLSPDLWARCAQARQRAAESEEAALRSFCAPCTLRLRIVGTTSLSAFWSDPDRRIWCAPIGRHLGTFQDSILIRRYLPDMPEDFQLDFRYFPFPHRIEPYQISDGTKTLLIVNDGHQDVVFGYPSHEIVCAAGMTTKIDTETERWGLY